MKLLSFAVLIAILHLMIGCVSLKYQGVEYMRVGDQHVKNLIIETTAPDGTKISILLESQDSEATALNNAITALGGMAK